MFSLIKKHKIIVILSIILLITLIIKVLAGRTPIPTPAAPLPKLEKAASQDLPQNLDLSFEKQLPVFPEKINVYKISAASSFSLPQAKTLALNLGFLGEPQVSTAPDAGVFYNWTTPEKYLAIGGKPTLINFGFSSFNVASNSAAPQTDLAIAKAEDFLQKNKLTSSLLDFKKPQVEYYQVDGESLKKVADPKEARVIKISFFYNLNSLPLLNNAPTSLPVSVWLGPSLEILKMTFIKYPENFEKTKEATVFSKEEIERRLKNHEGTIIYSLSEKDVNAEVQPNYQINLAQITRSSLAYYYPPSTEETDLVIQPIFVFEADSFDQLTGKPVKSIIYLPATP